MPTWLRPEPVVIPEELAAAAESRALAEVLYRRGFTTPMEALDFLTGGIDVDAPGLPDLDAGVELVIQAVLSGQRICVYGDYDTDGVTSTTLLVDLLRRLGADVSFYIPNRFRDGYGMNPRAVEALAAEGTHLLLTCDCGIKNLDEVDLARKLGMTVVVTDHHELGHELPRADAVINPKRLTEDHPCRMLPGVGTAYLLAWQVLRALDHDPAEADRWLDLVAVGVIADVVPLTGANRELARRGLVRFHTSPTPGLLALLAVAGLEGTVTEEDVAFQIVPRLNAAGRLAEATLGVRLLLAEEQAELDDLAAQLDQLNLERKRLTAVVVEGAAADVKPGVDAILLYRPEWHEGVLGIAAGKLAEEYGVPALLMARKHGTNILVGSARAPEGFILHEALDACGEHLLKYGGHAGAAGFSLLEENLAAFRAAMLEEARRRAKGAPEPPSRAADIAIPLAQVDQGLYEAFRRMAPFGEANPAPVLFSRHVTVLSIRAIGPNEKHLRLVLRDGERSFTGVWWGAGSIQLAVPQEVDLFYRVGLNRWNGEETLQLIVEDLGPGVDEPGAAPPPLITLPELLDRRGADLTALRAEFSDALLFAEGETVRLPEPNPAVDRYGLRSTLDLVLLTPPASPRLLDEAVARTGAARLILGFSPQAPEHEERFLPAFLRLLAEEMAPGRYVRLSRLAVRTGELEATVRHAIGALVESDLLAVDEEEGDYLRLRRRTDGRGVKESPALTQMRTVLGESRAYRRFLRQAAPAAILRTIYKL
jgi:single-stranded-DNA-specific exonuclease